MQILGTFLFVFNSVSQLWIVIFIQGSRLRLSQILSHSMGVCKYFSIKNSEDQTFYCIGIKNALVLGGKYGNASYEFDKTSKLQACIFELCFFFFFPSSNLALFAVLEIATKSGGCTDQPKTRCASFIDELVVPSDVFHRMSYIWLFLPVLPLLCRCK